MDGGCPMPTTGSRHFPRSQKVKDTCDMCSASKVRCNKEKPICGRCDKLGYPCFYSPARRMGRPHPSRRTPPQNKPGAGAGAESLERQPMIRPGDGSVEPESNASFDEAQISLEHDIRERTSNRLQGSENDFNDDGALDIHGSVVSPNGQMNYPQTDHDIPKESPHISRRDHMEDTAMFNFHDRIDRANSIEVDVLYCQAISSNNTSTLLPHTSRHRSSTSSTIDQSSGVSAYGDGSSSYTSNASKYDCATVAMNMLQHLNMMNMEQLSISTSGDEIKASALDGLNNTVSMTIKRVSTILVCPCSQKTDVGLLAAAVCGAILDIYGIMFRTSTRPKSHWVSVTRDADRLDMCTESLQDESNKRVTVMWVLEGLPKVANLVMQFTRRYSQDTDECSADFLPAVAVSLKSRLKSMINEATNWLAQI